MVYLQKCIARQQDLIMHLIVKQDEMIVAMNAMMEYVDGQERLKGIEVLRFKAKQIEPLKEEGDSIGR